MIGLFLAVAKRQRVLRMNSDIKADLAEMEK